VGNPAGHRLPSDADLDEINKLLDWHAGTLLPDGRLLGRLARRPGKRSAPGAIPDSRIRLLNRRVPLKGLKVLEVGCFEGIHTTGLRLYCDDVTAIDARPQNVLKTLARLSWHGTSAKVFQMDAERIDESFPSFDLIFHFGVLYHLRQPVQHLKNLAAICQRLFLDTHIADEGEGFCDIEVEAQIYRGAYKKEGGWRDPFSGLHTTSLWLTHESLIAALSAAGFGSVEILQQRPERNGPRVLLLAQR
jgi:SAM-dependent methyltransferase